MEAEAEHCQPKIARNLPDHGNRSKLCIDHECAQPDQQAGGSCPLVTDPFHFVWNWVWIFSDSAPVSPELFQSDPVFGNLRFFTTLPDVHPGQGSNLLDGMGRGGILYPLHFCCWNNDAVFRTFG